MTLTKEDLFQEASRLNGNAHIKYGDGSEAYYYKGFRVYRQVSGEYIIQDCRFSPQYQVASASIVSRMYQVGMERTADLLQLRRDVERVRYYEKYIADLYERRKVFVARLKSNPKDKRAEFNIQILEGRIEKYVECLIYFNTRRKQLENKYNLNDQLWPD